MKKSLGPKTVAYPLPVFVIGTYDKAGKANVMTASWCGICCSKPPAIAVSLRKATYTYGNVVERQCFTVSVPSETYLKEVDYFGIASGRNEDKFSATGLTAVRAEYVDAPYVQEFPIILECKVLHTIEIGLHTQFIGEILDVKADDSVLDEKGAPDVGIMKPFCYDPQNAGYHGIAAFLGKAHSVGRELLKRG
jgi:flavin reductase (DIM6/NTAB) family NADH-FMN oxidoreductase RutF